MTLRELGEDELLRRILSTLGKPSDVLAAAGDDCAIVRGAGKEAALVLKTDCVVEGVHFKSDAPAHAVGWKAMARPLSDFAAMSAAPQYALVTLIAPANTTVKWTTDLYRGLKKAARRFGVAIVGGETSNTRGPVSISVTVIGEVVKRRWILRTGGKQGDDLFVTGRLGGSLKSGRHLRFVPRIEESRWLTEHFRIHAMIDLSDGLGADLPRLATASGNGFDIDKNALPLHPRCTPADAISDGEDYELLFAIAPQESARLQRVWKQRWRLKLTKIGRLTPGRSGNLKGGYAHYTQRA